MAARTAIGLDIGTSGVRAAELTFGKDGVVLERFGQVALPTGAVNDGEVVDSPVVADAIRRLWQATAFSTRRVCMGVANQRVVVRTVDLPVMPEAELRKALPFEVADLLPMPVEDALIDFHPLETVKTDDGERMRGLMVAAARETVLSNVRCARQAGLDPTMVDLTSFAVLRAVGRRGDLSVETEALVDVGARVTNVIVHSDGVPRFVRIMLMGGQDVTDAVSERAGVPLQVAEALKHRMNANSYDDRAKSAARAAEATLEQFVNELRGSLEYYRSANPQLPVQRVVLSGGGSLLAGLGQRIEEELQVPVTLGNPMASVRIGNTGLDDHQLALVTPLSAVPVGLALGAST